MEKTAQHGQDASPVPDVVWGLRAIGEVINRTEGQTAYLVKTGALAGARAVTKVNGVAAGIPRQTAESGRRMKFQLRLSGGIPLCRPVEAIASAHPGVAGRRLVGRQNPASSGHPTTCQTNGDRRAKHWR